MFPCITTVSCMKDMEIIKLLLKLWVASIGVAGAVILVVILLNLLYEGITAMIRKLKYILFK